MRALGSSASDATRPACSGWASSPRSRAPPQDPLRRDRLHQQAVHGERLQVREPFLQGEPLLVKLVPRTPEVQRDLPSALLVSPDDLDDLLEPPPVVRKEGRDSSLRVVERPSVRRHHDLWVKGDEATKAVEVVVQRV